MCAVRDGTVTMRYAMYHWPEDIINNGPLCWTNAQNLEAANQEAKGDGKKRTNRQVTRVTKTGHSTRGRMAQILARSIMRQVVHIKRPRVAIKDLRRHVKKSEDEVHI